IRFAQSRYLGNPRVGKPRRFGVALRRAERDPRWRRLGDYWRQEPACYVGRGVAQAYRCTADAAVHVENVERAFVRGEHGDVGRRARRQRPRAAVQAERPRWSYGGGLDHLVATPSGGE